MLTAAILVPILLAFLAKILFAIDSIICKFIDILYECFEIFAGIKTITFNNKPDYLTDVFFESDVISTVYWGMACIGFAMMFGFAIVAVVRKIFDSSGEKVKATYGHIFLNCFKSLLLILLMTAIVSATLTSTRVLMQAITDLFDSAELIARPAVIYFTDEDYATMFRIYDTIGNYSLNPSYDSRYNLNACFNDIRNDMQDLEKVGVFEFSYLIQTQNGQVASGPYDYTKDKQATGLNNNSWQYALLQIYKTSNIYKDMDIDAVDENLHLAIKNCMYQIKTNPDFKPIQSYSDVSGFNSKANMGVTIGRTIMLTASFGNAKQGQYDNNPGVTDALRYPYYIGQKNVYDYDTVEDDFEIGIFGWNHMLVIVVGFFLIKELLIIIVNAAARIFNIILLYLTAPAFLAVMPLDDGGKFKQWTTAFVIQSLALFGSLFAMRLLVIFIPLVMSSNLRIFSSSIANYMAKLALLIALCVTSEKASGMISGILADNAGYQSIMAGSVGEGVANSAKNLAVKAVSMAATAGMAVGKGIAGGVDTLTGVSTLKDKAGKGLKHMGQALKDRGGVVGAAKNGLKTDEDIKNAEKDKEEKADKADTKDFRNAVGQFMNIMSGGKISAPSEEKKPEENPENKGAQNNQQQPEGNNPQEGKEVPPSETEK